jgi:hypothetical protein
MPKTRIKAVVTVVSILFASTLSIRPSVPEAGGTERFGGKRAVE